MAGNHKPIIIQKTPVSPIRFLWCWINVPNSNCSKRTKTLAISYIMFSFRNAMGKGTLCPTNFLFLPNCVIPAKAGIQNHIKS
jgi:hypothetical protein